jgi:hypothetical protein
MEYAIGIIIVIVIVWAIAKAASGDRYSKMTEAEFEAEARRSSSMGSALAEFQKVVDPSHGVQYVQEQQQRIEAEDSESGDRPETGSDQGSKS